MGRGWRPSALVRDRVGMAAWNVARGVAGGALDLDDLRQVGMLAVWRAGATEAAHAYTVASSAMLDELRRVTHARCKDAPHFLCFVEDHQDDGDGVPGWRVDHSRRPDLACVASRAVDALQALPEPWPQRIEALLQADNQAGAAALLGVSQMRVSQYVATLRQHLAAHV